MAELGLIYTYAKSLSLGGGTLTTHSSIHHILLVLCISTFHFLSFSLLFLFYFYFPKHKKTKNISVISLCLLFSFLVSVCFTLYFRFGIQKIQKDFALFAVSFCSCFKI
jgi:hypothetical protein